MISLRVSYTFPAMPLRFAGMRTVKSPRLYCVRTWSILFVSMRPVATEAVAMGNPCMDKGDERVESEGRPAAYAEHFAPFPPHLLGGTLRRDRRPYMGGDRSPKSRDSAACCPELSSTSGELNT